MSVYKDRWTDEDQIEYEKWIASLQPVLPDGWLPAGEEGPLCLSQATYNIQTKNRFFGEYGDEASDITEFMAEWDRQYVTVVPSTPFADEVFGVFGSIMDDYDTEELFR